MMLEGNVKSGFRIWLHIKDLMNAVDSAYAVGFSVPLSSLVMAIIQALKVDGKEQADHGELIQFYEKPAQIYAPRVRQE